MLDRESTFANPIVIKMLKEDFVPVAIDQWYTRRQRDTEGDFWRKIAGQSPRNDFRKTTQGLFIADASGKLLAFNNNRGSTRILEEMQRTKDNFIPSSSEPIVRQSTDEKYAAKLPAGGIVVRVSARVEAGYKETEDKWLNIFQSATSRDNLWITKSELEQLRTEKFPPDLARRIERFHLIDNTRGEPKTWTNADVKSSRWEVQDGKIHGKVELENTDSSTGYAVTVEGEISFSDEGAVSKLNLFARGEYWGASRYTLAPPPGKFPLVVSFTLADGSDIADPLAPHSSRGWLEGYLRPRQ